MRLIVTWSFLMSLLLFHGCTTTTPTADVVKNPHILAFKGEDKLIMVAVRAKKKGNEALAYGAFKSLYKQSGKHEYFFEMVYILASQNKYEQMEKDVIAFLEDNPEHLRAKRLYIQALVEQKKYVQAKNETYTLLQKTKDLQEYSQLSEIYRLEKNYKMALKYLERAYAINFDETVLDHLVRLLYFFMDRSSDAIAMLETHSRIHGCSQVTCIRLSEFYGAKNNIDGMISVYERLYNQFDDRQYATVLIKLYAYRKDTFKLITLLEKTHLDDHYLLELYASQRWYDKAITLAETLYEQSDNIDYLGRRTLYAYEVQIDKDDKDFLNNIIDSLEKVVAKKPTSLYQNYLGYLLIDHDIDYKKGIVLVEKALEKEPESAYYLDSLAWGYYKLGKCKEAAEVMDRVVKKIGLKEEEVRVHHEKIKECR
jgi:tetratricopeptide (TPR) repeat protein